ncbi:MAG: hypothetical protein ACE5G5_08425 [Candidatus Methylomirabilales bacterium]
MQQSMDIKLFPLDLDIDGRTIVLAHPWPTTLDQFASAKHERMALSWVTIRFGKVLVITPITFN